MFHDLSDADKTATLAELRRRLVSWFEGIDDADDVLHPLVVNDAWRMAELLKIDTSIVPTEGRALTSRPKMPS